MVVLPPLPEAARKVLIEHDSEILRIFEGYAFAFATKSAEEMGIDDVLSSSQQDTVLWNGCRFIF